MVVQFCYMILYRYRYPTRVVCSFYILFYLYPGAHLCDTCPVPFQHVREATPQHPPENPS
jgi:hypothetical protein